MRPILCDPRHVVVAVPRKPSALKRIVSDYPQARAAFRGGFSYGYAQPGVGLLRIGGAVLQPPVGDWPCLYCMGDKLVLAREGAYGRSDWAIAAGPILLSRGFLRYDCIRERDFADVTPYSKRARTAVGVRADGKVVIGAFPKASLPAVAKTLLSFGCVDALAFDGGHGTDCYAHGAWYRYEGTAPAVIPNALLVIGPCVPAPVLPPLGYGSRGEWVRKVQSLLAAYNPGPVDGIYGPRTRGAVRKWQEEQGLNATGEVGPYEWHRLGVM